MRPLLLLGALGCLLASSPHARGAEPPERDGEPAEAPDSSDAEPSEAPDSNDEKPSEAPGSSEAREDPEAQTEGMDVAEETTRALERSLVRRGGLVLRPWSLELEPLVAYGYREPTGHRRDTFSSSMTVRLGLPWEAQGEVRVPFVLRDRQSGAGATSGLGDIGLGLTKLLLAERELVPELLVTARWKTTTGSSDGLLPTGTGANGLQGLATAVKRDDPLVLLGSAYYVWNVRSGGIDVGDAVGVILAVILAATPETSVLLDIDMASFSATRIGGERSSGTERLSGILEIGLSTVIGRDLFLNLTAAIGVTPSAPDLQVAVALPFRI